MKIIFHVLYCDNPENRNAKDHRLSQQPKKKKISAEDNHEILIKLFPSFESSNYNRRTVGFSCFGFPLKVKTISPFLTPKPS